MTASLSGPVPLPSTPSPVSKALELVRWSLGSGPAGSYCPQDLEWYEIYMSPFQWITFRTMPEMSDEERRYPRCSYNAATSRLIIQCIPSPLHQSICELTNRAIAEWTTSLPRDQKKAILVEFGTGHRATAGRWKGSKKIPDLGIKFVSGRVAKMKWAMEVGFSQDYNSLKENARLWLEGMPDEVDMVTLVHFEEDPRYRYPLPADKDPSTQGIPLDIRAILAEDIICTTPLGPAIYRDLTWVGRITKVSMETWIRGGDGKAKQEGLAKDLLHEATIEISVRDILPPPYHGTIVINLDDFRELLSIYIRSQACDRCQEAVDQWIERIGNDPKDRDYEDEDEE